MKRSKKHKSKRARKFDLESRFELDDVDELDDDGEDFPFDEEPPEFDHVKWLDEITERSSRRNQMRARDLSKGLYNSARNRIFETGADDYLLDEY